MTQQKLKILAVDDEAALRNLLRYALPEYSYHRLEVEAVSGGREAVDRVIQGGVDLVIMDLRMAHKNGKIDGLEAIRRIREFSQVPILVLTAHTDQRSRDAAKAAGANTFMAKPIRAQRLVVKILSLISEDRQAENRQPVIKQLYRQLNILTERQAQYGMDSPLWIITRIEDIQAEIAELEGKQ